MRKSTLEEFIKKAKIKHGNKYDYSKFIYTNNATKGIIICPDHGEFRQIPNLHAYRAGCPKCSFIRVGQFNKITQEEFIEKSIAIHGDKYDYSKVNYVNMKTKVTIICSIHGEFEQLAKKHLEKIGCTKCSNKYKPKSNEWIKKAQEIHGNKYDYSKVNYLNNYTKVTIICQIHGEFNQKPHVHLYGHGCPICKSSKGELTLEKIFKKHNIKFVHQYRLPEITNELYYDFYLPNYNILIEFHGGQHYNYIPYFHKNGEDDFLKQKNRDTIVKHNAKYYKYNYLEFNYKQLKYMTPDEFERMVIHKITKFKKTKDIIIRL